MAGARRLDGVDFDTASGRVVWLEGRSGQGTLVVTTPGEAPRDVTTDLSPRARVGYGGGDFTAAGGTAFFVADGRLYRQSLDTGRARPLTPRFGDLSSPQVTDDGRWVLFVHSYEDEDSLAVVDAEGRHWPRRIARGHDFYMWPRWSPGGDAIAFVAWDHPAMPWDQTTLYLAQVIEWTALGPILAEPEALVSGADVAAAQPEFSPDGRYLAYISDATGWNQLYTYDRASGDHQQRTTSQADHGGPAWGYETRAYGWLPDSTGLVFRRDQRGFQQLWRLDLASGVEMALAGDLANYTSVSDLAVSGGGSHLAVIAAAPATPPRLLVADPLTDESRVVARSAAEHIAAEDLARPEPLAWASSDGVEVYGLYYPPTNPHFHAEGPAPLVVSVHGGPTGHARAGYESQAQFLATRGYGVLAVNYRGSTGHGKPYMAALRGNWGVHDVEDSVSGARALIEGGLAAADQIVIMGGSAGGYTVLQAMIDHPRFFKAGVCLYGVANHFALADETHKFEARYLDSMLGPLPQAAAVYRQRSPIFHADKINRPLAVFQGDEDRVVPRNQSEAIVESLRRRGVPHEYHVYAGEGHGWRKRETIEHFYTALESFLRRHVIFA